MADNTLVYGAGRAAQSDYGDGYGKGIGGSQAMTKISKHISEGVGKAVQDKNREFNKAMKAELNRDPSISDEAWKNLYERLEKKRFKYVYLNKKDRMLAEQDLKKEADEYLNIENKKTEIAETTTDEELFDNPDFVASPQATDIQGIVTGENEVVYDENGKPGYMISNQDSGESHGRINKPNYLRFGHKDYLFMSAEERAVHDNVESEREEKNKKTFMTIDEVDEIIKNKSVDTESKKAVETMVSQVSSSASELQVGENSKFNYKKTYNNVRAQIIEKGNLESLANNDIIDGRNFKTDLFEAIEDSTYEELDVEQSGLSGLGLTKEEILAMDPSGEDGKITYTDAAIIVNEIMGNKDMLKDYLSEYYTNFMEQNWNSNLSEELSSDFSSDDSGINLEDENTI